MNSTDRDYLEYALLIFIQSLHSLSLLKVYQKQYIIYCIVYCIYRDRHVQPISMNFDVFFIFKSNSPISTLEVPKIVSKNFFGAL